MITYGVFVDDAAGEILVRRILDIPNGYQEAGRSHLDLIKEFKTEEEAHRFADEYNGNREHYLVYVTQDGEYYYSVVHGEYFGTYQQNAYSTYDNFVCDVGTLEELQNYL